MELQRRLHSGLIVIALCGLACDRTPVIDAPRPTMGNDSVVPPILPPSSLDVPIVVDLSPVIRDLDEAVPNSFGDIADRLQLESNSRVHIAFEAERGPFQARLQTDTAILTAVVKYRGRAWYNAPVAPEINGSCGTADDHDDRPRALITVSSPLTIGRDYVLRSAVSVDTVMPASETDADACRITALRIDVTDRVMRSAADLINDNASRIDSAVSGLDLRSRFQDWWDLLRTPIELSDSIWLVIDPIEIRRGAIRGQDHTLRTRVGLSARPTIVVGPRPDVGLRTLPPLESGPSAPGLHILIDGVIDYQTASQLLERELVGRTIESHGHSVNIRALDLTGIGNGRLSLEVTFDGDARGHLFLVGTPEFDPVTGQVAVPDLDFDVASSSLLIQSLDWLRHEEVTAAIRERARFPVSIAITEASRLLHDGLNRNLSDDVSLSGEVLTITPIGVYPTVDRLHVLAHATATARMVVNERPDAKSPRAP